MVDLKLVQNIVKHGSSMGQQKKDEIRLFEDFRKCNTWRLVTHNSLHYARRYLIGLKVYIRQKPKL
jgi:hypothetical protein